MSAYELTRTDGCIVTGSLVDGKVDGEVVVKWPSGELRSKKAYAMNTPIGVHTTWDESGQVVETITYENGISVLVNGEPVPEPEEHLPPGGEDGDL